MSEVLKEKEESTDSIQYLQGKKVLVVTESLGPINGVTRATEQLLEFLLAQGVTTAVAAPQLAGSEKSKWAERLPLAQLSGLPLLYNPELRVVWPFRLSKLYGKTFRPDLIYLASPASLGLQVWWQARRSGIPLIANFQTDLAYYSRVMLPSLLRTPSGASIDWLTGYFYRHPAIKAVLCPSTSSLEYLKGLGVPAAKLHLVGRGVDCHLFDPAKRNPDLRHKLAPNGEILLLCVSRLGYEKGFEFLAQAYEEVTRQAKQRNDLPPIRLVITGGNTNPAIEQNIRGFFDKRGLDTHFTGPLTGEPLAEMFASSDIFVFPSLTETFGQVIQEAMASGLPVVARRKGGPADLVLPDQTGFLADPSDLNAFSNHILRLVESAELRVRLGETARKLAETRSWDAISQQIASIMVASFKK